MNTTRRGAIAAMAGGALAAGCVSIPLVKAGSYQARGTSFAVTLARPWSDVTNVLVIVPRGVRVLTIDGVGLNQLYLASIAPDASLIRVADRDTPRPTYRTDMGDTELVEFVIDSLATAGLQDPSSSGLRPQPLAGAPGVRFDISARTAAGLNMSGAALAARAANNSLHLLLFLAPSEHYYGAFAQEVDAIFASARAA
ncbi:MAG: hypothetical protein A4S17_02375 [Proteobacteria bacterium HN_bin10]|nr:MAG: hypothetical protein A4S17_02375 [Proteobacteria bacterium HN_bin10]